MCWQRMVLQVAGGKYKSDRSRPVARMGRNPLEIFSPPPEKNVLGIIYNYWI